MSCVRFGSGLAARSWLDFMVAFPATKSIRARFVFTVGSNLFRGLLSFTTGMLLARWLGPASYGNMAFLLGTFLGLRQLLDLGSSFAFFTFLSQRPRSKRFVLSYYAWLAVQFLVPLCVIGLIFPSRWIAGIWHGHQRGLVLLAFAAAFMQNGVWPIVQQAGESQRATIRMQGIGVIIVGTHLLAVWTFWRLGILGLYAIFAAVALEHIVASIVAYELYVYRPEANLEEEDNSFRLIFHKYLNYCFPLVFYSCVGFGYEFADRWLLQKYGGGVQQAYYSVGAQFAGVALIATASILSIFWKEVAEAHQKGDHERAGRLYQKVSRLLFLVGAVIAGFIIPWAKDLVGLILGVPYAGSATTMIIMFLYPIHQSMGRIGGTMLYATERVPLYVGIGIIFMIISMVVTYFMLAPADALIPGLGLASEGLAIKMVALQLIQVNVVAYIISRIWSWPFDWVYQPVGLFGCLGLGWLAHFAATGLLNSAWPLPALIGLGGLVYLLLIGSFIYCMPWLVGLTRDELLGDMERAWRKGLLMLQTVVAK
jgi:O-antigen/teichoic acid export membrane protein